MNSLHFKHYAIGWQIAEEAFLDYSTAGPDGKAEFIDWRGNEIVQGILDGVDSICAESGILDDEREMIRQMALAGFSTRWQQLLGTSQPGGRA